jgi:hypothetical protein
MSAKKRAHGGDEKMKKLVLGLLITVLVMAVPGLATPITIVNQGFDDDPLSKGATQPLWNIGYVGPNPARTCTEDCIGPWTLTSGNVDWVSNAAWQPHNGNWSIDLNGDTTGVITMDLGLLPAGTYDLAYWMSKNYLKVGQVEMAVKMTGMDVPLNFVFNAANTKTDMMWVQKFINGVVITAPTEVVITFQSLQTLPGELGTGPAIDDVTLTRRDEGVPEPGTLWTLLTGAGLLGLAVKLRRK